MPLYFFQRTGELTKYFFLGSFLTISALMVTTLLATRTPIIILGVLLLINFYYGLKKVKYSSKAVILILFSAIIYSVSALDFANFELTSFLYERMTSDDLTVAGSRTEMWLLGLENIFIYPLGGEKLNINYFHNLWLDLRYEAGVVPMIFLILLSFIFNYSCWRVVMSELFTIQFKFFIGSVYLTLFLMMFVEPVIQGSFVFFLYYIFFGGVLTALKDFKFNRVDF
jgi:O-antigen ligase